MAENRLDRIEAILERMVTEAKARDEAFDKRIVALIARHEALSETVEMMVQSWFRKGPPKDE